MGYLVAGASIEVIVIQRDNRGLIRRVVTRPIPPPSIIVGSPCDYCGQPSSRDARGGCAACGAPKKA